MSNSLDPDQVGPNCLQRLSADEKSPPAGNEFNLYRTVIGLTAFLSGRYQSNTFNQNANWIDQSLEGIIQQQTTIIFITFRE